MSSLNALGARVAVPAALLAGAIGCGGSPAGPSDLAQELSLPMISTTCAPIGQGSSREYQTVFFVWGLSTRVLDGAARPLEAVLRTGEVARLSLDWEGCGFTANEAWVSRDPGVASVVVDPSFNGLVARLTAVAPGVTDVHVDFEGPDKKAHRTYPAYCPASQYVCVEPRTAFTRVRVVAPQ
jgi:hypothetical protein